MSTQTEFEIERLRAARNKLRAKGVELGITTGTAKLDEIAEAFDEIVDQGDISAEVKEGETFTIPAGFHSGSGTVAGVSGGGNYKLQSKTVTPTKKQQSVTPDTGNYGLSDVIVQAIPDMYQDVTPVTAGAGDVLANKVIVNALGQTVAGTMPNNGTVNKTLDTTTTSQTIAKGYHSGSGKISITMEEKSTTPTKSAQDIVPSTGKVLSKVTVEAIPDAYQDVSGVTASGPMVLEGYAIVTSKGVLVLGDMKNNGAVTPPALNAGDSYTVAAGYHSGTGKVTAASLASQTEGTAEAADILAGEVAWVDGVEVTGTMPNIGAQTASVNAGGSVTISKGYHDGTGKITGNSLASQTPGDAAAANILTGKKAWVAGSQVTGTMPNNGATGGTIDGLTSMSLTIPAGYTTGGTVSLTSDIEEALAAI